MVWPCLTFLPADRRVADGLGHDERLDRRGRPRSSAAALSAAVQAGSRRAARRSPRRHSASGRRRPGGRPSRRPGAPPGPRSGCSAGARISRASTRSIASSNSPVLGLADWPPWTTAATPKSRKIAARPSPATTATTARSSGPARVWRRSRSRRVPSARARSVARPVNAAALDLADVARLVVEVLDADPAQRPEAQPVADHQVGPLVVDVDLERPRVAGDQHGLADRLEVVADGVDVERA